MTAKRRAVVDFEDQRRGVRGTQGPQQIAHRARRRARHWQRRERLSAREIADVQHAAVLVLDRLRRVTEVGRPDPARLGPAHDVQLLTMAAAQAPPPRGDRPPTRRRTPRL